MHQRRFNFSMTHVIRATMTEGSTCRPARLRRHPARGASMLDTGQCTPGKPCQKTTMHTKFLLK